MLNVSLNKRIYCLGFATLELAMIGIVMVTFIFGGMSAASFIQTKLRIEGALSHLNSTGIKPFRIQKSSGSSGSVQLFDSNEVQGYIDTLRTELMTELQNIEGTGSIDPARFGISVAVRAIQINVTSGEVLAGGGGTVFSANSNLGSTSLAPDIESKISDFILTNMIAGNPFPYAVPGAALDSNSPNQYSPNAVLLGTAVFYQPPASIMTYFMNLIGISSTIQVAKVVGLRGIYS